MRKGVLIGVAIGLAVGNAQHDLSHDPVRDIPSQQQHNQEEELPGLHSTTPNQNKEVRLVHVTAHVEWPPGDAVLRPPVGFSDRNQRDARSLGSSCQDAAQKAKARGEATPGFLAFVGRQFLSIIRYIESAVRIAASTIALTFAWARLIWAVFSQQVEVSPTTYVSSLWVSLAFAAAVLLQQ